MGDVSASGDTGITARGTLTGLQRKVSDVSGKLKQQECSLVNRGE